MEVITRPFHNPMQQSAYLSTTNSGDISMPPQQLKMYSSVPNNTNSTVKRRKPLTTYRSPSAGMSDDSSMSNPQPSPIQTVRLIVTPSTASTITNTTSAHPTARAQLPPIRIRIPPHKDWYTMKPIPRAPLPLYHPLRVVKRPPPRPPSTALPLVRKISPPANEEKGARPTRSRRPPLKLREAAATGAVIGGPGSPTSTVAGEEIVEKSPEKKARRPRRKKAEIIAEREAAAAAAAAAAGEDGLPQPPTTRRKRKRAMKEDEEAAAAAAADATPTAAGEELNGEEDSAAQSPRKRRRRGNNSNNSMEDAADMSPTPTKGEYGNNTSTYGTRSRTKKGSSGPGSVAGSEDAETVDGGEATPAAQVEQPEDGTVTPTNGRRRSPRSSPPAIVAEQKLEIVVEETMTQSIPATNITDSAEQQGQVQEQTQSS